MYLVFKNDSLDAQYPGPTPVVETFAVPLTIISISVLVDLNVRLEKDVSVDNVNDAVRAAADSGPLQHVLQYSTLPVVSTDIIGNPHSSIFDAPFTRVVEGNFVKTLNWYDNEWGYSNRVADLLGVLHGLD